VATTLSTVATPAYAVGFMSCVPPLRGLTSIISFLAAGAGQRLGLHETPRATIISTL